MLLNCNQKILKQLEIQPQELVPKISQDSTMSTQEGRTFQRCGKVHESNQSSKPKTTDIVEQNENTLN